MAEHLVEQGECLSSIAEKYGFKDYRSIYDHPQNRHLRQKRPNPNVLHPGDLVFVPDKEKRKEPCSTEKRHRFVVKSATVLLRIYLKETGGKALANLNYTLAVGEQKLKGRTDGEGLLKQEIPADVHSGKLTLDDLGISWELEIGHLDPVDDKTDETVRMTGIQARLNNLGYFCGAVDGVFGPLTEAALKRFQKEVLKREEPDGKPDRETRDALVKEHAS
jgi:N-acetylmuramoyl-L-alanine amidase